MSTENYGDIKALHDVTSISEAVVALLNSEWPRKGSYWYALKYFGRNHETHILQLTCTILFVTQKYSKK